LLSIADISAACEIYQLVVIKFDFSPYPRIREWLQRLFDIKEFADGHEKFIAVVKKIYNPDPKF
jgi:glutathione S-transferase